MRLVDCYIELFYYTLLLKNLLFSQLEFDNIRKHYDQLISRAREASHKAGFSDREWLLGLFAVCVWIDETVLTSDWAEKDQWARAPFQLVHFKTMNAGQEFFERLESIDEKETSLLEVFDYCLALGFKGRYFQPREEANLRKLIQANLARFSRNPDLNFPEVLFPDAYSWPATRHRFRLNIFGVPLATILGIALPVLGFFLLFYIYEQSLIETVVSYYRLF